MLALALPLAAQSPEGLTLLRETGVYSPCKCGGGSKPRFAAEYSSDVSVTYEDKLILLDEFRHPLRVQALPALPPDADHLKYRTRHFWAMGKDHSVLQYDPERARWMPRLLSKESFEDFEITFDGRIVLLCTPTRLAEFHHPGASEPESSIAYPALEDRPSNGATPDYPWFFWKMPVFGLVQEYMLVYFPNLGRLYKLNVLSGACDEVEVPWKRLDAASAIEEVKTTGLLSLTGRPTFSCVEFVPESSTALRVAWQQSNGAYRFVPPAGAEARGRIEAVTASTDAGLHWLSLDLRTNKKSQVYDEPQLQLPLALDGQGAWVPAGTLLAPQSKPRS